jgi:hypothetical protein
MGVPSAVLEKNNGVPLINLRPQARENLLEIMRPIKAENGDWKRLDAIQPRSDNLPNFRLDHWCAQQRKHL